MPSYTSLQLIDQFLYRLFVEFEIRQITVFRITFFYHNHAESSVKSLCL